MGNSLKNGYKFNFAILEGLRGIAATYVVINHARGNFFAGGSEMAAIKPVSDWSMTDKLYLSGLQLTSLGHEFVILFFLISGISISHSLKKSASRSGFLKRRLIRIYPPYILGLLWAILVFLIIKCVTPQWLDASNPVITARLLRNDFDFLQPMTILKSFFYMPSGFLIVPFWSLTQEVIFYICIIGFFLNVRLYLALSLLIYLASWIVDGYIAKDINPLVGFFWHYNIFFAAGIFLYQYRYLFNGLKFLKRNGLVALSLLLFAAMIVTKYYLGDLNKITEGIAIVFSFVLIFMFEKYKISNAVLKWMGSHSYTMYITHFASLFLFKVILNVFFSYSGGYIFEKWIWPIAALFAVLFSYALFFLAERPTIKYLSKTRNLNK